eukprot:gene10609-12281_t
MQHKIYSCWQQLVASELLSDNDCLQTCMKPGSGVIERVCIAYVDLCGAEQQLPDSYLHQDKLAAALDQAMPLVSEPSRRKLFFVLCSLVFAPPETAPLNEMRMTSPYHPPPFSSTTSAAAKDSARSTSTKPSARNAKSSTKGANGNNASAGDGARKEASQSERNGENPYLGKSPMQISTKLAKQLGEPSPNIFVVFVTKLGAEAVWEVSSAIVCNVVVVEVVAVVVEVC